MIFSSIEIFGSPSTIPVQNERLWRDEVIKKNDVINTLSIEIINKKMIYSVLPLELYQTHSYDLNVFINEDAETLKNFRHVCEIKLFSTLFPEISKGFVEKSHWNCFQGAYHGFHESKMMHANVEGCVRISSTKIRFATNSYMNNDEYYFFGVRVFRLQNEPQDSEVVVENGKRMLEDDAGYSDGGQLLMSKFSPTFKVYSKINHNKSRKNKNEINENHEFINKNTKKAKKKNGTSNNIESE